MNVWHKDEGDDGVTGWQPIGEPLKRNNKYDCMNKEQILKKILEDVKWFFGPQDEKFAEAMYKELVANGTIKEK